MKKIVCEICDGYSNCPEILEIHHVIPRSSVLCSNSWAGLICLCPVCHSKIHLTKGKLTVIGFVNSTKMPYKRTAIFEIDGKRNIEGIDPVPIPALNCIKIRSK